MRTRDFQRTACYIWERAVKEKWPDANALMSVGEIHTLVQRVWGDHRPAEQPPALRFAGRRWARGSRHQITIPVKDWAMRKLIVLHEIAHSLAPVEEPWHGSKFASFMLELWENYAGIPSVEARQLAEDQQPRRVQFAHAATCQEPTQEWQEWKKLEQKLFAMLRECRENEPDKYEET